MVTRPVLVTGATGGLGRILVETLLEEGRQVIATGRNRDVGGQLEARGARFLPADLTGDDLNHLCRGVGTIFHLAALSSPWGPATSFHNANVVATERLLTAAHACAVERFVFASSPSIYTRRAHQIGLTEASPLPDRPVNEYARTKLIAEQAVLTAAAPEFFTVALRPRAVIGPYDTVLLPRLERAAARGVMPLPGMGRALIEPSDARDVAAAFVAAGERADRVSGRAFNLSGGVSLPLVELAAHAFSRLNRKVRLVPLPAGLVLALGRLAEMSARFRRDGREPAITAYAAIALGWSQTFDLSAARERLGWEPKHHPFEAIDWALQERTHA